ncbi:MAG: glutaredoxin family protein [Nitrospirae bacterium]|nr:glutaredoxin family protein [Nitrospirota bacterium]MBF0534656.1 glutaredoxin family protein [Nitrospirota bacterium]MBF0616300.1 glutaredoxin family protein [Nitrospirota bacterium]
MEQKSKIVLFALSTCQACKKTKTYLNDKGLEYILVELDTVDTDSREKLLKELRKYNPRETFPTVVVDGGAKVMVGYDEQVINGFFNQL